LVKNAEALAAAEVDRFSTGHRSCRR
jgi:hypothetical protein